MTSLLKNIVIKPENVLLSYVLTIIAFAILHYGAGTLNKSGFGDALYFSVVTVTTLGYGDILPEKTFGKILACSEAIYGIIVIGIFLNSIWHLYVERLQKQQHEELEAARREHETAKLTSFLHYFSAVIDGYNVTLCELTTPIGERNGFEINKDFKFSDLQDLYKGSLFTGRNFFKPIIESYFEQQDDLANELKYLLSNFELLSRPHFHKSIIDLLLVFKNTDVRQSLLSYEKTCVDKKKFSEILAEMIREREDCPDISEYRSHIITPAIYLFHSVKDQVSIIEKISAEIKDLMESTE